MASSSSAPGNDDASSSTPAVATVKVEGAEVGDGVPDEVAAPLDAEVGDGVPGEIAAPLDADIGDGVSGEIAAPLLADLGDVAHAPKSGEVAPRSTTVLPKSDTQRCRPTDRCAASATHSWTS